jgi:hypothetical protein
MMRLIKLIYGLFLCLSARGQLSHIESENSYISSGAYSKHFTDAFSFTSNPACLATIEHFQSGVLTERKWMLQELDNYKLAASFRLGNGGCGIAIQRSGDADYNELGLNLAYGKKLGRLQIGISFICLTDRVTGYKGTGFISSGIGFCFRVSEKLTTGWELGLPVSVFEGRINPEKGPQFFKMGFGYESGPDLFLSFQVEKTAGLPVNLIGYIEYRYSEQFFLAFGMNSLAGAPYFKSGWKKNRLSIEIYTLYEPVLGFSPGVALFLEGKSNKE